MQWSYHFDYQMELSLDTFVPFTWQMAGILSEKPSLCMILTVYCVIFLKDGLLMGV